MTAPQSSGIEAIRADIRQDATHPKKDPMRRMGPRAKHVISPSQIISRLPMLDPHQYNAEYSDYR
jgi:hypothetical protein